MTPLGMGVLAAGCLLLGGCAHLGPAPEVGPALEISTQYAPSTGPRVGFNTFEVYLENRGSRTIRFETPCLDGRKLPPVEPTRIATKWKSLTLDGGLEVNLPSDTWRPDPNVTWWQYYPTPVAKPGECVVLQVNLKNVPTHQRMLVIPEQSGLSHTVTVSRFRMSSVRLTAVTFERDFKRMFVQFDSPGNVDRLLINGRIPGNLRLLLPPEPGQPRMFACHTPPGVRTGTPLHVSLTMSSGETRHALVRALSGIVLDAPFHDSRPSDEIQRSLTRDRNPDVVVLPADFTCTDFRANDPGRSAPEVVAERQQATARNSGKLVAASYCAGMFPEGWNIYGQIADAACAKPHRLSHAADVKRFIEEDEEGMVNTRLSAQPRPFLWIPESYRQRGRFLDPQELEVLAWTTLMQGCKGIRYHFWLGNREGFDQCVPLQTAICGFNRQVRTRVDDLSPLVLESVRVTDGAPGRRIKLYTAWSGDSGLLLMLRNLEYVTDDRDNLAGTAPRFHAEPQERVSIRIPIPSWLKVNGAWDFLSGSPVKMARVADGSAVLEVDRVEAFRLVWVGESRRAAQTGVVGSKPENDVP